MERSQLPRWPLPSSRCFLPAPVSVLHLGQNPLVAMGWLEGTAICCVHVTEAGELFIPDQSGATITASEQRAWLYFSCVSGDILAESVSLTVFTAEVRARQPSDKLSE